MKRLLSSLRVALITACGVEDPSAVPDPVETENTQAALTTCGVGGSCAAGQHIESYQCDQACGSCAPNPYYGYVSVNSQSCAANSERFVTCGAGCPNGWHSTAFSRKNECRVNSSQAP